MSPVLVAILPQAQMQYFDVQSKTWKPLLSMVQLTEATACFCAEYAGNYLYVAAKRGNDFVNYRYHVVSNTWDTIPGFFGSANQIDCLCCVEDHIYAIHQSLAPRRYSISTNQWQYVAKSSAAGNLGPKTFCNKAAVAFKSCLYVLYGQGVKIIRRRITAIAGNQKMLWFTVLIHREICGNRRHQRLTATLGPAFL